MVVNPAMQRRAQVVHGARRAQAERLLEHLIVPRRFVVGMQQDVRVPFDQAWQQCRARQLDDFGRRCRHAVGGPRGVDAIAADPDRPALVHGGTVEHAGRLQDDDPGGVTRRRLLALKRDRPDNREQAE